jgi:hypothetical protein
MDADEAMYLLQEVLKDKELDGWQWSMLVWASQTCMADGKEAEKCRPKMPSFDGETRKITLKEAIRLQKENMKSKQDGR